MANLAKLGRKYNKQAWLMARQPDDSKLAEWRHRLLKDAKGEVLELAAGAGANFPFYPAEVEEVTAVDVSPKMLRFADEKARKAQVDATFILGNIEEMDFPHGSFDTIVSTLSFCGYEDPVALFNKLAQWCKPTGTILLLEHGISTNKAIQTTQRILDPINHKLVGCHLKRDMLQLIESSSLRVTHVESHAAGIIRLIWAQPKKD